MAVRMDRKREGGNERGREGGREIDRHIELLGQVIIGQARVTEITRPMPQCAGGCRFLLRTRQGLRETHVTVCSLTCIRTTTMN